MFASTVKRDGQNALPKVVPRRKIVRKQPPTATADAAAAATNTNESSTIDLTDEPSQSQVTPEPATSTDRDINAPTRNSSPPAQVRASDTSIAQTQYPHEAYTAPQDLVAPEREASNTSTNNTAVRSTVRNSNTTAHLSPTRSAHNDATVDRVQSSLPQNGTSAGQTTSPLEPVPRRERAASEVSRTSSHHEEFNQVTERLKSLQEGLRRAGRASRASAPYYRFSNTTTPRHDDVEEVQTQNGRPQKRRKQNGSIEQQAAAVVEKSIGNKSAKSNRRPGRRLRTPDNAEAQEIVSESVTMGELCTPAASKMGKRSATEKQMAENWVEILRRRKEDADLRLKAAQEGRRKRGGGGGISSLPEPHIEHEQEVVQMVVENGAIVAATRDVDRAAALTRAAEAVHEEDLNEDADIYKRVNQMTVGFKQQIAPGSSWDDASTELFYQGMTMFGTDFKMISNMIPGKNRRQVKLKYNIEERINWERIKRCLSRREEVKLDQYAQMTGLKFTSAEDVYKQMDEDEKAIRDADEARRREEGIISKKTADNPATTDPETTNTEADVPVPSVEGAVADDGQPAAETEDEPETDDQRAGTASTVATRATAQPTAAKKRQQVRKTTQNSRKGRKGGETLNFEGVEERLGAIDDVTV